MSWQISSHHRRTVLSCLILALNAVATSACSTDSGVGGRDRNDPVSALVVQCEVTFSNPCIGSTSAPGGTTFDNGVSAKIAFYFDQSGYVGALDRNAHAVTSLTPEASFAPMPIYGGSQPRWNGVCWSSNVTCLPRDGNSTEKGAYQGLASALSNSSNGECKEIGRVMWGRIYDEWMFGRRAFFMYDTKILGVDPDGKVGILAGTAHINSNDAWPDEIGVYSWSGRNLTAVRLTMIHETAHFLGYSDTGTAANAYSVAGMCLTALGG